MPRLSTVGACLHGKIPSQQTVARPLNRLARMNRTLQVEPEVELVLLVRRGRDAREKSFTNSGSLLEISLFNNETSSPAVGPDIDSQSTFPCTVCVGSFESKFDWQRHEEGAHKLNNVEWVCMFHDDTLVGTPCMFCPELIEDPKHLEQHGVHLCLLNGSIGNGIHHDQPHKRRSGHVCKMSSLTARTFARKDGLVQHVRNTHLKDAHETARKSFKPRGVWVRPVNSAQVDPETVWCGFCQLAFEKLADRMVHVADHLQEGLAIERWIPRWAVQAGYESNVELSSSC